jgi:hypothetical protein
MVSGLSHAFGFEPPTIINGMYYYLNVINNNMVSGLSHAFGFEPPTII